MQKIPFKTRPPLRRLCENPNKWLTVRAAGNESARAYCQLAVGCGEVEPCPTCRQAALQMLRLFGSLLPEDILDQSARELFDTVQSASHDA